MSEIRATTISDAAGTGPITLTGQSAAKAWVNYNATGTVAIRDSVNVSSLTDISTGVIDTNFTTAMSASDTYGISSCANSDIAAIWGGQNISTRFRSYMTNLSGTTVDHIYALYTIHGDLA